MICERFDLETLGEYTFVVILSIYKGRLLLSRHKARQTWETQGGHVDAGETPLQAAKRELYEESGAVRYTIAPLFDYHAGCEEGGAGGMVFAAHIEELGAMPESEMAEVRLFDALPDNLTYPEITPHLYRWAQQMGAV